MVVQEHLTPEDVTVLGVLHPDQVQVLEQEDRHQPEPEHADQAGARRDAGGVLDPREQGVLVDRLRMSNQGHERHDDADADGLELRGPEHQEEEHDAVPHVAAAAERMTTLDTSGWVSGKEATARVT